MCACPALAPTACMFLSQEYAVNKVRELGLESGEAIDAAVLEGRAYSHLDAMRYRLNLLQTLVCVMSHIVTLEQAGGLWLGLVESALSDAELDLSFEALLGLGRDAPQGLTTLAGTFFNLMCCQDGATSGTGNGHRVERLTRGNGALSPTSAASSVSVAAAGSDASTSATASGTSPAVPTAAAQPAPTTTVAEQRCRPFDLHKLRPSGFRFFMCCLEVTNLAIGRLRLPGSAPSAGDSSPEDPGPMPGPMMRLDVDGGADSGAGGGNSGGVAAGGIGAVPRYVVVSMDLLGLETLWSIALEVEDEEVSEAAIKKLCEVSCLDLYKWLYACCTLRTYVPQCVLPPQRRISKHHNEWVAAPRPPSPPDFGIA